MGTPHQPKGLDTWIYLLDTEPLPVLPSSLKLLRRCLKQAEFGLADLANIMATDPVMRLHVLREAKRAFKGRLAGDALDLHHCLSLLGEQRVVAICEQFSAASMTPRGLRYQTAVVRSQHALTQLAAWHQVHGQAGLVKNQVAALCAGVPDWCLWHFAPREAFVLNILLQERVPADTADTALLGCRRSEIAQKLAKRWGLPDIVQAALCDPPSESARFWVMAAKQGQGSPTPHLANKNHDGELLKTPAFIVHLAHWLVAELETHWYSRQSTRVLGILAAYLEVEYRDARRCVIDAALVHSRQVINPGIDAAAVGLLQPPNLPPVRKPQPKLSLKRLQDLLAAADQIVQERKTKRDMINSSEVESNQQVGNSVASETDMLAELANDTEVVVAEDELKTQDNAVVGQGFRSYEAQVEFAQFVASLMQGKPLAFHSVSLLERAVTLLYSSLHVHRVTLLLCTPDGNAIQGHAGQGWESAEHVRAFSVSLNNSHFFKWLLKKPQVFHVASQATLPTAAPLPKGFTAWFGDTEFSAGSILMKHKTLAIFLLDVVSNEGAKDPAMRQFTIMINALNHYLSKQG